MCTKLVLIVKKPEILCSIMFVCHELVDAEKGKNFICLTINFRLFHPTKQIINWLVGFFSVGLRFEGRPRPRSGVG